MSWFVDTVIRNALHDMRSPMRTVRTPGHNAQIDVGNMCLALLAANTERGGPCKTHSLRFTDRSYPTDDKTSIADVEDAGVHHLVTTLRWVRFRSGLGQPR